MVEMGDRYEPPCASMRTENDPFGPVASAYGWYGCRWRLRLVWMISDTSRHARACGQVEESGGVRSLALTAGMDVACGYGWYG